MLSIFVNRDDHLLLHMIDDFIAQQSPATTAKHFKQERMDSFLAEIAAAIADLHPRAFIGEQVGHLAKHAVVDEVSVRVLQFPDRVLVLENTQLRAQLENFVLHVHEIAPLSCRGSQISPLCDVVY